MKKTIFLILFSILFILTGCKDKLIKVTFDSLGGNEVNPVYVKFGHTISLPEPIKDGYTFDGWYTGFGVNDSKFSISTSVTKNITLYAKWIANQYTITFNANGGSNVEAITQDYGTIVTKPTNPINEGYMFVGWYTNLALTNLFGFTTMPAENITLYAKWKANQYTIDFISNGGSEVDPINQDYGTTVTRPTNPSKEGYLFGGWYIDEDLTNLYSFAQMPPHNLNLYAKWQLNTYSITYIYNGGKSFFSNPKTYTIESTITLNDPIKEGYTFNGWYRSADFSGEKITTIPEGTFGNLVLYAKWEINQYDVKYYIYKDNNPIPGMILLYEDESIVDITLGYYHSSALTSRGRLLSWGHTEGYQLGDVPTDITDEFNLNADEKIIKVSLGLYHSCAITSQNRLFYFGINVLDDGIGSSSPIDVTEKLQLKTDEKIINISLGAYHSSALTSQGRIFTWGLNGSGQLGDGTTTNRYDPVDITDNFNLNVGETIINISSGYDFLSALTSTGRVFTWGYNNNSELGDGTTISRYLPTDITDNFSLHSDEIIIKIFTGTSHSSILTSKGRMFTWGSNNNGVLGDGSTTDRSIPVDITSRFFLNIDETIINISLGGGHSSIITSKGRVFTWGYNTHGNLGDGSTYNRYTPTDITSKFYLNSDETIDIVSLGLHHSSALTSKGQVFTWGSNEYGQLGDTTTINRLSPQSLPFIYCAFEEAYNYNQPITEYHPVREGFTFSGWFIDANLTYPYIYGNMPSKDLILYGKWN